MGPRLSSVNYLLQVHHHHYCGHVVVCLVHEPLEPSYKQINDIEYDQQWHSMQHTTLGPNSFAAAGRGYVEPMLLH